jgi:DNA end-binding protein Ku
MVEIAEKIIAQLSGAFDPSKFTDRYEDALKELIAQKEKGRAGTVEVEAQVDTKVVDLMAVLRKSLGQGGERRGPAKKAAAHPRRKSATRKRAS